MGILLAVTSNFIYGHYGHYCFSDELEGDLNINESTSADLISQMMRSINSREYGTIAAFFRSYASKDALFIKKVSLYSNNSGENGEVKSSVIANEDLEMNTEQFIDYLYAIVKAPEKYAMNITTKDFQQNSTNSAIANIEIKEYSTQKDENQKILKIASNSICNVSYKYSGILTISGMNCVESMVYANE